MADPFTPWLDFWKHSTQIVLAVPQTRSHQTSFFSATWPCAPSTLVESQQRAWEKMLTAGEMWWTLWLGVWSPAALMSNRGWDGQPQPVLHAVRPAPRRTTGQVEAEVRQLRQG